MKKLLFVVLLTGCPGTSVTDTDYTLVPVRKICIEGHVYFLAGTTYGSIAPKLNDDGRPVKCSIGEK